MNKKLFAICFFAGVAASMNACEEGAYNDLKCDDAYQTECLSAQKYMVCEGGMLTVKDCAANTFCHVNDSGVGECVPFGKPLPVTECTNGAEKCENGSAYVCSNGQWGAGTSCANGCDADNKECAVADNKGTEGNACREIAAGADGLPCDAGLECNSDNICQVSMDTLITQYCELSLAFESEGTLQTCEEEVASGMVQSCGDENGYALLSCSVSVLESANCATENCYLAEMVSSCKNEYKVCGAPVADVGDECEDNTDCLSILPDKMVCVQDHCAVTDCKDDNSCDAGDSCVESDDCIGDLVCSEDNICTVSKDDLINEYCDLMAQMFGADAFGEDPSMCKTFVESEVQGCPDSGISMLNCAIDTLRDCAESNCSNEDLDVEGACEEELKACHSTAGDCKDTNTCQLDDACEDNDDCAGELVCTANVCSEAPKDCKDTNTCQLDDACVDNDDCVGNLVCDSTDLKCRKAQKGEYCETNDDCVSGLGCDTRVPACAEVG